MDFKKNKSLGLLLASGLLTLASLIALSIPFKGEQNIYYWLAVLGLLVLNLIVVSFSIMFNHSAEAYVIFSWLVSTCLLVIFPWHYLQVLVALVFLTGILQMNKSITSAFKARIHFSYYRTVKSGMSAFLTAVIFLISLNIFISTQGMLTQDRQKFYDNMAALVVKSSRPLLHAGVTGFNTSMTLDEFILRSDIFDPQFEQINRANVNSKDVNIIRENILDAFGVGATGDEQVINVIQRVVITRIQELFAPFENFIPVIYAIVLFLSLRFVMPIMIWMAGGLGTLLFKLGLRFGWIKMEIQTTNVEVPRLGAGN